MQRATSPGQLIALQAINELEETVRDKSHPMDFFWFCMERQVTIGAGGFVNSTAVADPDGAEGPWPPLPAL